MRCPLLFKRRKPQLSVIFKSLDGIHWHKAKAEHHAENVSVLYGCNGDKLSPFGLGRTGSRTTIAAIKINIFCIELLKMKIYVSNNR